MLSCEDAITAEGCAKLLESFQNNKLQAMMEFLLSSKESSGR